MSTFLGLDYSTPTSIRSTNRTRIGNTISLKRQVDTSKAQRWDLSISLAPSYNNEDIPFGGRLAVHRATNGTFNSFTINMPQHPGVSSRLIGNPDHLACRGATAIGEDEIAIESSSTVTIPAGLYITVGADKKVYQVIEDVEVTSTDTDAVLKIYPSLSLATVNNTGFDVTPTIDVYYAADGGDQVTYRDGVLIEAVINVEEAIT